MRTDVSPPAERAAENSHRPQSLGDMKAAAHTPQNCSLLQLEPLFGPRFLNLSRFTSLFVYASLVWAECSRFVYLRRTCRVRTVDAHLSLRCAPHPFQLSQISNKVILLVLGGLAFTWLLLSLPHRLGCVTGPSFRLLNFILHTRFSVASRAGEVGKGLPARSSDAAWRCARLHKDVNRLRRASM